MVLGDGTGFVGAEQITQGVGLSLEFGADVSLGDLDAGVHALKDPGAVGDVHVFLNGGFPAAEGLMGDDAQHPGVVDEGVAGDAGGGLVGFAEAAVDDDELAAALDGTLAPSWT